MPNDHLSDPAADHDRLTASAEGVSSARQASFTVPGMNRGDSAEVIAVLDQRLVAFLDLAATLKHVHWNVVGRGFIGVHELLDQLAEGVLPIIDATAERIATLGGSPNGLPGYVVAQRTWADYSIDRASVDAHLAALDLVYEGIVIDQRDAVTATEHLDPITHDMLVQQSAVFEQQHWFVRAHLEDAAGGLVNAGTSTEFEAAAKATNRTRPATTNRITND